jgi:hypothetical protein
LYRDRSNDRNRTGKVIGKTKSIKLIALFDKSTRAQTLNNMDIVLRELQHTIMVEDPCHYALDKNTVNSIIDTKYNRRAFFKGSYADRNMILDNIYWKKVYYDNNIVWYEFLGKHFQLVN